MSEQNERNLSIDIAKVWSTFMIFILHVLLGGVILKDLGTVHRGVAWYIEYLCLGAVNVYALITGYLNYNKEVKWKRIAKMYGELLLFSLIAFGIAVVVDDAFSVKRLIEALFPISNNQYWYFNAYLMVVFLMPFLNLGIKNMDQKAHRNCIIIGALALSVLPTIFLKQPFAIQSGYSGVWIAYLYLVGAYIRKYITEETIKKYRVLLFAIIFILPMIPTGINLYSIVVPELNNARSYASNYNYLLTFISSVAMFLLLLRSKVRTKFMTNIVLNISSVTLWMYIFHCSPTLFDVIKRTLKHLIPTENIFDMVSWTFAVAFALFTVFYISSLIIHRLYNFIFEVCAKSKNKKKKEEKAG